MSDWNKTIQSDEFKALSRTPAPEGEVVSWRWVPTIKGRKEPWMTGDATPWVYHTGAQKPEFPHCRSGEIQDLQPLYASPVVPVGENHSQLIADLRRAYNDMTPRQIERSSCDLDGHAFAINKAIAIIAALGQPVVAVSREEIARQLAEAIYQQVAPLLAECSEPNPEDYINAILAALGTKATDTGREG